MILANKRSNPVRSKHQINKAKTCPNCKKSGLEDIRSFANNAPIGQLCSKCGWSSLSPPKPDSTET